MTLVGRTALSVEMNTKCVAPVSTAVSTMFLVPSTLLVTASTTLSSISGTCLCAAAWKTAKGRCGLEDLAHPAGVADVGDHRDDVQRRDGPAAARTGCRRSGSRRAPGSRAWPGPSAAIWRQSSLPMDPPAPVISTVRS